MVGNVAKLTRVLRDGVVRERRSDSLPLSPDSLRQQREKIHSDLRESGKSLFTDEHGNTFLIERGRE
jgi:hypothetical protein